jgi:PRTRC genetic system protein B
MTNISHQFSDLYVPYKALLIYNCDKENNHNINMPEANAVYVESYDIGRQGNPINAHPLTVSESIALAEMLQSSTELQNGFLRSKGILPAQVLHINPHNEGYAVWYTPAQQRNLFFVDSLGIPCGNAFVPAMLWKATRQRLQVFALKGKGRPTAKTTLSHAPFFNIYEDGAVCMGTVDINIDRHTRLEDFMARWEQYFFNSYFSHGLAGGGLTNQNIVQLWQQQVTSGQRFPEAALKTHRLTLNALLK